MERWDLERALETLTPQDQELLLLRYANQVPLQALSRLTGLSRFAIYRRCGRLLTQLREAARGGENMNRRLKRALAASFSPPPPQRKTVFLRTLPQPDLSLGTFLWNQIPYLRKRTWLLSCGVLLPAVWGGSCMNPNVLWITAALLPFVALLAVTEGTRSAVYGMEELELATRFSLKSVLLARLCLVGEPARRPAALPDPPGAGGLGRPPLDGPWCIFWSPTFSPPMAAVAVPPAAGAGDGLWGGGAGSTGKRRLSFGGGVDADTVCAVEFSRMAFGGGSAVGGSGQGTGPNQERSGGSMELVIRALSKQYPHKLAVDGLA